MTDWTDYVGDPALSPMRTSNYLFGLKADARVSTVPDNFTGSGHTVTVADGAFTGGDVGKIIYASRMGTGYTYPILPVGEITAVNSATEVETSTAWVEPKSAGVQYEIVWGTDDTDALLQMGEMAQTTGSFHLPAGRIILRKCPIDWRDRDQALSIRGESSSATIIHLSPDYDFTTTDASTQSCLLFRTNLGSSYPAVFEGFSIRGPLFQFPSRTAYHGLINAWPGAAFSDIWLEGLNGLGTALRMNSSGSLHNVTSILHLFGGTTGIHIANFCTGTNVHTGNCAGSGLRITNIDFDAANTGIPLAFVNSLFDECGEDAARIQSATNVRFTNCVMFGGPHASSWALNLLSGSEAVMSATNATGYGNYTERKGVTIDATSKLTALACSKIASAGDGTGTALANNGVLVKDATVRLEGTVTGSGTITTM